MAKNDAIKVRCDRLEKSALLSYAAADGLPLAEIVRRAARDYVRARQARDLEEKVKQQLQQRQDAA